MKYCTHCGKELLDAAVICPSCGQDVSSNQKKNNIKKILTKNKKVFVLLAIVAIIVAAGSFISLKTTFFFSKDEKQILKFVERIQEDYDGATVQVQSAKIYYGVVGDYSPNSDNAGDDMIMAQIMFITDGTSNRNVNADHFTFGHGTDVFIGSVAVLRRDSEGISVCYMPKESSDNLSANELLSLLVSQYAFSESLSVCKNGYDLEDSSIERITRITGKLAD